MDNFEESLKPPSYYTQEDVEAIDKAGSFKELNEIAMGIIHRIGATSLVCGPITSGGEGSLELNIMNFKYWIDYVAREHDATVFNQLPFEKSLWRLFKAEGGNRLMEVFYGPIFDSESIKRVFFIPRWASSNGAATFEHPRALEGHEIFYLPYGEIRPNDKLAWVIRQSDISEPALKDLIAGVYELEDGEPESYLRELDEVNALVGAVYDSLESKGRSKR